MIRSESAGWEEWKTEKELMNKSKENPNKYYRDEDGDWHFPPGEEYAARFGLYFKVCSSKHINWMLIRNYKAIQE